MAGEVQVRENSNKNGFIKNFIKQLSVSNIALAIGWLTCALCGAFPQYNLILSLILFGCVAVSWKDDNFYVFLALFMFFREWMIIAGTPVFRIYSYMLVIKFLVDLPSMRLRVVHFPIFIWLALYSVIAVGAINLRSGFNIIVDMVLVYGVLIKILADDKLMRKFLFVMILGGVASGIYGWTSNSAVEIRVGRYKTSESIQRYYGALYDANFAGFFYNLCFITSLDLKGLRKIPRIALMALFIFLMLQTGSLSSLITCGAIVILWTILKFRHKAVFFGSAIIFLIAIFIAAVWTIPALNQIEIFNNMILRINERIVYLQQGRWDLLTTDRYSLWVEAMEYFKSQDIWSQLIGGNVITSMITDESIFGYDFACHQTYIQSLLDFGIIGTVMIFGTFLAVFVHRLINYLLKWYKNDNRDIKRLQILYMFAFFIFGFSVDFFVEWRYLFFYFI